MSKLSMDDLRGILVDCAGGEDAISLHGDISFVAFDELGYDSLALIETAAKLQRDYGVRIPEEQIGEARTPVELLDLVNQHLTLADRA